MINVQVVQSRLIVKLHVQKRAKLGQIKGLSIKVNGVMFGYNSFGYS